MQPKGRLELITGTYFMQELHTRKDGVISINATDGPVVIHTGTGLDLSNLYEGVSAVADLVVTYQGNGVAHVRSAFTGTLVAPAGRLNLSTVHTAQARPHIGFFAANELEVHPNTTIQLGDVR